MARKPTTPAPQVDAVIEEAARTLSPHAIGALLSAVGPAATESLADYAARIEEQAQPLPVCQITHPGAKDGGLHVGKYAGIRLVRGDAPAALLSNGSTI